MKQQQQPRIFNHNLEPVLSSMQSLVPGAQKGFEYYSGRPLCVTGPGDIIQLPSAIEPGWNWITQHYERVCLPHTREVVWDDKFGVANRFPDLELSPFLFGPQVHSVRPDERWLRIATKMNEKNEFIQLCQDLGLPVPVTCTFVDATNFQYDGSFPVYLKTDTSASGLGVVLCSTKKELFAKIKLTNGPFQLQEPVDQNALWLNLTYEIVGDKAKRITATKQVLKGYVHNGNQYPTGLESDPWEITDVLMAYLVKEGMRGMVGFDLAMTAQGPLLIECNPRYNGSCYPAIIAHKLGIPQWKAMNFETSTNCFSKLNLGNLEFDPSTGKGVIVFNWGPLLSERKIGILLAGDENDQFELERALMKIL